MRSRWWRALPGGLAAVVLAGCAGIPTSGPVHEAGQLNGVGDEPFTRIVALGPAEGAGQTSILTGFLGAAASFDDNHAIAREYLTPEAARTWSPTKQVLVYQQAGGQSTDQEFAPAGKDTYHFSQPEVGELNEQGAFTGTSGKAVSGDFTLARVDGQWRIAKLPPQLYLTTNDLQRAYRAYDIYFPNPSRTVLVPDEVLVPVGPGVSTSLVRAVLQGPSPWLGKVVRTAVPAGTRLVVDSVPISDGVAQVDLTGPAATVARDDVQAMSAQIVYTLRQLGGIAGVRITVEGVPLQVPGQSDVQNLRSWGAFDPDGGLTDAKAYAVTANGHAVLVNDTGTTKDRTLPVRGVLGDGRTTSSLVVPSYDGTALAALDVSRKRLVIAGLTAGASGQTVHTGTRLSVPSWDAQGDLFVVDTAGSTSTAYMVPNGSTQARPIALDASGLPKSSTIAALRVSRDGTRVAALVEYKGAAQVYLGLVVRSGDTVSVGSFRVVTSADSPDGTDSVVDVAWESADRLLVLQRSAAETVALQLDLNGTVEQGYGSLPTGSMVAVTAAPNHPILCSSDTGQLYEYNSGTGSWQSAGAGAYPAYPS